MLSVDFLLTSSESAFRKKIEALNTSSLLNCYINQRYVSKNSEKRQYVALGAQLILLHAHKNRPKSVGPGLDGGQGGRRSRKELNTKLECVPRERLEQCLP